MPSELPAIPDDVRAFHKLLASDKAQRIATDLDALNRIIQPHESHSYNTRMPDNMRHAYARLKEAQFWLTQELCVWTAATDAAKS